MSWPGRRRRAARPGPTPSSARRPVGGCAPGTARARCPSRSATPGRHPSTRPSASATRSRTSATPSGCLRSTATERRLRFSRSQCGPVGRRRRASRGPVDAEHVGPGVGQEHAGVGAGPDPGQLDDPDALERAAHRRRARSHRRRRRRARRALATMAATTSGRRRRGDLVAHVRDHEQLGAGDGAGRGLAAVERDQGVGVAVDHQGGRAHTGRAPRCGRPTPRWP